MQPLFYDLLHLTTKGLPRADECFKNCSLTNCKGFKLNKQIFGLSALKISDNIFKIDSIHGLSLLMNLMQSSE
jgi:hypothetical protein